MRRILAGFVLILHGLAHALPGAQAGASGQSWLLTPIGADPFVLRWVFAILTTLAMTAFVAAGLGLWSVAGLRRIRRGAAYAGALASLLLLVLAWPTVWAVIAAGIDVATIVVLNRRATLPVKTPSRPAAPARGRRAARSVVHAGAVLFVLWIGAVSLTAPWHRFWGSTRAELAAALPGDAPFDDPATYWIQHGVTIDAPPSKVWPWLAQLGTDRGGFYSYAALERAFGIDVHNADRIHPEWQHVEAGDTIIAAPAGYFGIDHPLGWKLTLVEPGRAMVLENWGAFVLVPGERGTTRFIVRTRNRRPITLTVVATVWLGLTFFEPAHFIMERGMLLGVKRRAEQAGQLQAGIPGRGG